MVKPYTWEEIKFFLINELKKTKHIMTFGTIGSCNVEHDVDLIITKEPKSKSSAFYKEVHNLFWNIDKYIHKKYGGRAVFISGDEKTLKNLANFGKKDLFFDFMVYTSFPQIENDWKWAMFYEDKVEDLLFKEYSLLKGEKELLRDKNFLKRRYGDSLFLYMYHGDVINSQISDNLILKLMNSLFDFLYRKRLGLNPPYAKDKKQVKKYFYKLCDIIDSLENKK
ncbi:MAG: hypothetical protein NUV46_04735 [Nanoarchaeota archaeon]|nr:hypothetical protein [Nanoarchaeota archaeon]